MNDSIQKITSDIYYKVVCYDNSLSLKDPVDFLFVWIILFLFIVAIFAVIDSKPWSGRGTFSKNK